MNCGVNLVFHRTAQSPMKTFSFSSVLITVKERATPSTWNTKKHVCVYFLLHRGQTICHVKRWNHCELTFSHSAQYSPGTHTSGCWGSKRTHNQIHTHTHTLFPADGMSSCLSDIFLFFFSNLSNITSWACACTCIFAYKRFKCLCEC